MFSKGRKFVFLIFVSPNKGKCVSVSILHMPSIRLPSTKEIYLIFSRQPHFFSFKTVNLFYVLMCTCMLHLLSVVVTGHVGVHSLLSHRIWGLHPCYQAWQTMPLPTEPSQWTRQLLWPPCQCWVLVDSKEIFYLEPGDLSANPRQRTAMLNLNSAVELAQ